MLQRGLLFPILLFALAASGASAQNVELSPFVGFRYGGDLDGDPFDVVPFGLELDEGASSGLVVSFRVRGGLSVELIWSHQATELVETGLFEDFRLFDVDVDYYHAGVAYEWRLGQVRPFAGISVGATVFDPDVAGFGSDTRFSIGLGGGAKLMLSRHFGFRLEARLLATDFGDDGCHDCYDGGPDLTQGELRGGLIFAF